VVPGAGADTPLDRNHEPGSPVGKRTSLIRIDAIDTGRWGDRLCVWWKTEQRPCLGATLMNVNNPSEIILLADGR
jgi:hypothetical protein